MDLDRWLDSLGLGEYATAFAENRIGPDVLGELTEQDLRDIGIAALGDRKRLMAAIRALDEAAPAATPEPAVPAAEGERRQVTVLFADIAGFTAMSERLGAEATHAVLNRYFAAADRLVEEFGGAIDKHIGDNVMAVFGAPVAHDNDPERAVRAALAIHDAALAIHTPDGPLRLHVGIASGQVVASGTGSDSHREYTVIGESVNLAARLQALAGPGETLVSEALRRQLDGRFALTGLGPQSLKGIEQPVTVWRVDGAVEGGEAERATPFVGRRAELGQCRAILAEVAETGLGRAVLLRGVAGIGKTRLAEAILAEARAAGYALHRTLVLDFGARKGQDAVPALTRSLVGLPPSSDKEARAAAAARALASCAVPADAAAFLNDLLDLPQPVELRRDFDAMDDRARRAGRRAALAGLAATASRTQPQLIMVEDLHWADAEALETLAAIIAATRDCPVALVGTTRPEGDPMEREWRGLSLDQPVSVIHLGPLRPTEAREMAAGFTRANAEWLAECLERAAGNPLFLEQLLQNAAESTVAASVPGSIRSLVLARMDRLAPADRRALQAASVFGQRFAPAALRHLIDEPGYDAAGLLAHQLVRPEGEDLLFAHALIRDGVYESILTPARARLHLRAAEWFRDSDPALRAGHLDIAGDPGAARAYLEAARPELTRYRHEQAVALLTKGREAAATPEDRVALALALGEALLDTGAPAEARAAYAAALDEATGEADRCRALIGLASVKRITDDLDGALADLAEAEEIAARLGLETEESRAHYLHGNLLFPRGDIDGCLHQHGRALELARRTGSVAFEAAALGGLADAEYMVGRMRSARRLFDECVTLARRHGLGRTEVANLPMMAITAMWCGDSDEALAIALEAIEASRRVGHGRAEMIARHAATFIHQMLGDFVRAEAHIGIAHELAQRLGARRFAVEAAVFRAELLYHAGRRDEALADIRAITGTIGDMPVEYMGPSALGVLALLTDDPAERRAVMAEAEAMLERRSISHNHLMFRISAIEIGLRESDFDAAERQAAALDAFQAQERLPLVDFYVARGRALARVGRGERPTGIGDELDRLIAEGSRMRQDIWTTALVAAKAALVAA